MDTLEELESFKQKVRELNAWVIGIRPWEGAQYNYYDYAYTATWYLFHFFMYLLIARLAVDMYPHLSEWRLIFSTPDSIIEEWITDLTIYCTISMGILNRRLKKDEIFEPEERSRRGEWFPRIWSVFFIIALLIDIFGILPSSGLNPVTIALGKIFVIGVLVRIWTRYIKPNKEYEEE